MPLHLGYPSPLEKDGRWIEADQRRRGAPEIDFHEKPRRDPPGQALQLPFPRPVLARRSLALTRVAGGWLPLLASRLPGSTANYAYVPLIDYPVSLLECTCPPNLCRPGLRISIPTTLEGVAAKIEGLAPSRSRYLPVVPEVATIAKL